MIAKNAECGVCLHHGPDPVDQSADIRSTIQQITQEHRDPSLRMAVDAVELFIAQLVQQLQQLAVLTVDVANEVVACVMKGRGLEEKFVFHDELRVLPENTML